MELNEDTIELDVRPIAPKQKHSAIHTAFENLNPGHSMVLINDHDPKPIYYEFSFEKTGRFEWEYLERGPEVWKVVITKR